MMVNDKIKATADKAKMTAICAVPAVMACPLVAHATEGDPSLTDTATTALTAALTTMAASISDAIAAVLPVAIPLVGAGLVVTIGLSVFKRIANMA